MTRRVRAAPGQGDLFAESWQFYPVRRPVEAFKPVDMSLRIKTALGKALKECPDSAAIVAARISELTGRELTEDALYALTAPSKPDHDISVTRLIAFVRVTKAFWLWDLMVEDDGLVVLEGREAKLAEAGALHQQRAMIDARLADLQSELGREPVRPSRRGGRR
jgi:hypothetical protein